MSSPASYGPTEPVSDTPPVVPPPSGRKPTASEKADQALALITDLDRKIESLGSGASAVSFSGPTLTDEQAAALAKVPALDQDIDALGKALNEVAETVARVGDWAGKDVAAYEKLREDIRVTLSEIRAVNHPAELGDDVEKLNREQAELDKDVQHLRQEQGSYGRAIDALTKRMAEFEHRTPATSDTVVSFSSRGQGVLRKVLQLQKNVAALTKDKVADVKMGGYGFRSIDAAMDAVGHGIREVGLILRTEIVSSTSDQFTASGRLWTSVTIKARYVFVDPDDGSEHALEMVGEGRDLGDKATSKAASMAFKYALLQGLCIPFGAPESDGETTPPIDLDEDRRYQDQQAAQRDRARVEHERHEAQQAPADEPAPPVAEPIDDRTPGEKAIAVVAALNKLNSVPLAEARARLDRINEAVQAQGLGGMIVEGANLAMHLKLNGNLLDRVEATATQAAASARDVARG